MSRFKRVLWGIVAVLLLSALSCVFGCAVVADEADAEPAKKVVYLSSAGKDINSGETEDKPVATLSAACKKLGADGGVIVLCGKAGLSLPKDGKLPACGPVTLTSVYGGKDYRSDTVYLGWSVDLFLASDFTMENLNIKQENAPSVFCCGHNTHFGEGLTMLSSTRAPSIYGGTDQREDGVTAANSRFFDFTIRVDSGTWFLLNGGSIRNAEEQPVGTVGNLSIIINGGDFTTTATGSDDTSVWCGAGYVGVTGTLDIEINGGSFAGSIYGIGRTGTNSSRRIAALTADVNLTINGGSFKGSQIAALQDKTNFMTGDFTLKITNGAFSGNLSGINGSGVDGTAFADVPSVLENYLIGFGSTVYVSSSGDDSAAGTKDAPMKTLSAAAEKLSEFGGRITVLDTVAVADGETLPVTGKKLIISGRDNATDDSARAALALAGKLTLGSETEINYLTIKAGSGAEICANGRDLTLGAVAARFDTKKADVTGGDLTVTGDLVVSGGDGKEAHTVTINSGTYLTVRGGMSEEGTAVILNGGTVNGTVYGSGATKTRGSASVVVRDGLCRADLYATEKGGTADAGVLILGGGIYTKTIGAAKKNTLGGTFTLGVYGGTFYALPTIDTRGAEEAKGATTSAFSKVIGDLPHTTRYLFLCGGGTGDGTSPLTPAGTFSAAAAALGENDTDVTFVIMGEYNVLDATAFSAGTACTITSLGAGCDFSVTDDACLALSAGVTLGMDTTFDNIRILAMENKTYIAAACCTLVMEDGVRCEVLFERGVEDYVSLYGGVYATGGSYGGVRGADITVKAGNYANIYGGNVRASTNSETLKMLTRDIHVTISGGCFYGGIYLNGMNSLKGNATLEITGGEFYCPVFGTAAAAPAYTENKTAIKGDVTIDISGGLFCGNLDAAVDDSVTLDGTYSLTLRDGDFDRVVSIKGPVDAGSAAKAKFTVSDYVKLDEKIEATISFTNPVANYADPSVVLADDGFYYYSYAGTYRGKQAIYMTKAANLCDIGHSQPILVWASGQNEGEETLPSIWAPQLYKLDGKWYMYASCAYDTKDSSTRRPYVWEGGDNPTDPYVFRGPIRNYEEEVYIYLSPRILEHDGNRYMICGGFYRKSDQNGHQQKLFITKLSDPMTFSGKALVIATPTTDFEDHKILEGPFPMTAPDGTLYVMYAAGHTRGSEYCTGVLKFTGKPTDSVMNASLWEKQPKPMHFASYENRVYSPGAMIFTTTPDGNEIWGVYHAKKYTNTAYSMRRLYIQPMAWVDNYPTMEDPLPLDTVLTFPANEMPLSERVSGLGTPEKTAYIRPTAEPVADAEFDDVEPITDAPYKGSAGLGTGALIGIGAGAAAVIAGAAVAVVAAKKKKKAKPAEQKAGE